MASQASRRESSISAIEPIRLASPSTYSLEPPGAVLHQLDVVDAGQLDLVKGVQGIRVISNIEKGFGDPWELEDGFESVALCVGGGEYKRAEYVDVD